MGLKLSKPKARIHVLVPATISTSSQESERLNCCVLCPPHTHTHFFVPCSQVFPLCPAHISIPTIMPRVWLQFCITMPPQTAYMWWCFRKDFAFVIPCSNYIFFVDITVVSTLTPSHVYIIYQQVSFRIIILSPFPWPLNVVHSIVHFRSRKMKFCKPLRRGRLLYTYIHVYYTNIYMYSHTQYPLPFYVKFTKASNHELNVIIKF